MDVEAAKYYTIYQTYSSYGIHMILRNERVRQLIAYTAFPAIYTLKINLYRLLCPFTT